MKLLFCVNKDIHSFVFIRGLLEHFKPFKYSIFYTSGVGKSSVQPPTLLQELTFIERTFPSQLEVEDSSLFWNVFHASAIRMLEVSSFSPQDLYAAMQDEAPDVVISVRFGKIFKGNTLSIAKHPILNMHSGLLPQYRGILGTFWSFLHQQPYYGYTIHTIDDATIDTGRILHQKRYPTQEAGSLFSAIHGLYKPASEQMIGLLKHVETHGILPSGHPQEGVGAYYSTPTMQDCDLFCTQSIRSVYTKEDLKVVRELLSVPSVLRNIKKHNQT
jgi:methionyl-tRNA formyltransferase